MTSSETPDTITREELAEALRDLKLGHEDGNTFYPAVADAVFAAVERSREPEYEPGAAYQDANGIVCLRSRICDWVSCSGSRFADAEPKRPLRRLVPETPRPDHAAILAEIEAWASQGCGLRNLADRLCKLMEGTP